MSLVAGASRALRVLADAGFALVVVTNQTVVARGVASEEEVAEEHRRLSAEVTADGGPALAFYVCPHHPSASVTRYRVDCDCRKPRPGLLLRAAGELDIDLAHSVMVGDRISDIAAGTRAGCRTILLRTGAHLESPIESPDQLDPDLRADFECDSLDAAVDWILAEAP